MPRPDEVCDSCNRNRPLGPDGLCHECRVILDDAAEANERANQGVVPIPITTKQGRTIALVYQAGVANVFDITDLENPRRLLQHAFGPCEWYAQGLRDGGNNLQVFSCNRAGDITRASWQRGMEDCPFREQAHPPKELNGLRQS